MRRVEVRDLSDANSGDIKYAFEVFPKDQPNFVLIAKNAGRKTTMDGVACYASMPKVNGLFMADLGRLVRGSAHNLAKNARIP